MTCNTFFYKIIHRAGPFPKTLLAMVLGTAIITAGCNKQLDINPKGVVSEEQINTADGAEKLVIAAYAQLGNDHYDQPFSLW
ncbi:hypothetical protein, partial [Parafilimonas sp.]|uniref:hypothetical protein n=1 Tax=Parafilimonas sp. TaxID=1969739 RepID=UPI0039E71A5E